MEQKGPIHKPSSLCNNNPQKLSKEEFLASYHHDEINSSNICYHMKKRTFKGTAELNVQTFFLSELNEVPDVIRQMSSFLVQIVKLN